MAKKKQNNFSEDEREGEQKKQKAFLSIPRFLGRELLRLSSTFFLFCE